MLLNGIISIIIAVINSAVCLAIISKNLITLPKKLNNPYLSPYEKTKLHQDISLKNSFLSIFSVGLTLLLLYFFKLNKIGFQTATKIILGVASPLIIPLWFYYNHLESEHEIHIFGRRVYGIEGTLSIISIGYTIYMIILFCLHYFT